MRQPILTNEDLEKIRCISYFEDAFDTKTLDITYPVKEGADGMAPTLDRLAERAEAAVRGGYNIIIVSDRMMGPDRIPVPALLATAAVHHHLIRKGLRTSVGLVVETGEAREVHHFACLAGYGAEAINPYLAFESLHALAAEFPEEIDRAHAVKSFIKSVDKGLLKVMSKMGISTYQSYCGAQIFDAIGLSTAFVRDFFTGTQSMIEGIGLDEVARETAERHALAFGDAPIYRNALDVGGDYNYRVRGEAHSWTPQSVSLLQHAVRGNSRDKYRAYAEILNEQDEKLLTIRGLFRIKTAEEDGRAPVPLEEVEPAATIVRRFSTGAMSYGSISREAHTTLAIAMNRIGGKSNTGEGGEEADRYKPMANGDSMRSAIKQVASGRFGVTTEYLVNSDMIQIKMAQGAKPGEGGQLPGHKVDATIAKRAPLDAGRRPHLAPAAPRHLLDRGPGAAHLRPEERVADEPRVGEARVRDRRRHGGGGRLQGARRPRHRVGLRGRHGRVAADLDQARRLPVGDRPRRDAPDAGAEPPALAHRRAGRRRPAHGPRRGRGRAARGRRVRLRHRAADRGRLHHDAQVPPQHLPGGRGHAGPGAAPRFVGRPSTSSTTSSSSPRRCAS